MLLLHEPGAVLGGCLDVGFGDAAKPDCPAEKVVQQLRTTASCVIDAGLKNVALHLDRLTACAEDSPNYGAPVLRYKPKNLIGLIYLLLAMIYVTPEQSIYVRHCPVCGQVFFPEKSHCAWHEDACRKQIERKLARLGVSTRGLSAREKVRLYEGTLTQPC